MCRDPDHDGGAVLTYRILTNPTINQRPHDDYEQITTIRANDEHLNYLPIAPALIDIITAAWHGGAYDIRIIVDVPRPLRHSGTMVHFIGAPDISDISAPHDNVLLRWHTDQMSSDIAMLVGLCEQYGSYIISWRPNIGDHPILRSRRRKCGCDDDGSRRIAMPIIDITSQLRRAQQIAPADMVITYTTMRVQVQGIAWVESSHP